MRPPSGAAVEVVDLWKKFRRGEFHDSLRDLLPSLSRRLLRRAPAPSTLGAEDFWALREINFEVQPGEALGIIGPNGAGKSTLLKILTRILRPTRGRCVVRGRVGALIEVAAGFHPDLTGLENIFLQGAIMGMSRAETARKVDEIVEFAGVRDFLSTPVKRYSSGMSARLGFSIAAHLDPDVLIIDEVLAVGDMAFQEKCVRRMKEFKLRGVGIAFVSHNMQAVSDLCDRGIFLASEIRAYGPTHEAIRAYLKRSGLDSESNEAGPVEIVGAELLPPSSSLERMVPPGTALTLRVTFAAREVLTDFHLGFIVYRSTDGLCVYDGNLRSEEIGLDPVAAGERFTVDFAFDVHLVRGQYHVACHVMDNPSQRRLAHLLPAAVLSVQETRTYAGIADVNLRCGGVERSGTAGSGSSPRRPGPPSNLTPLP